MLAPDICVDNTPFSVLCIPVMVTVPFPQLLSETQIQEIVLRLGEQITKDYQGKPLVLIGVLRGAFIFLSDLCRKIDLPFEIDFVRLHSYGRGTSSSGTVKISKDIETDIKGKHVLIVEEIIDSGKTLEFLRKRLLAANPASLKVVALLDKPARRVVPVEADYVGKSVPDKFLVGYGLDYDEKYRSIPSIHFLEE